MEDSKNADYVKQFYLDQGFATRALHAGEHVGQPQGSAHTNPLYQSSTFVFKNAAEGAEIFAGERPGYVYTRLGNPTVTVLEAKMNALEGQEVKLANPEVRVSTLAFASGMAAISSTLLAVLERDDTLILGDVVYGATDHLARNVLPRFGVKSVFADTADLDRLADTLKANPRAKALLLESPTNPMLAISDIAAVVRIAKQINPDILVMVDNTFATPYLQRPLALGADVVLHSTTKYLCGHGTVVGGTMTTTRDEVKNRAYIVIKDVGTSPSPFDAWLVNLGIKTLPVRMDRHCANALAVARFLDKHPKVERVFYPGLPNSPGHAVAAKQMNGRFGGMVSFEIVGGVAAGQKLMDEIKIFTLAVSLGCVDSLIQHPASMTHACVPKQQRELVGVTDGLIRISVGLEDEADLITALDEALAKVGR